MLHDNLQYKELQICAGKRFLTSTQSPITSNSYKKKCAHPLRSNRIEMANDEELKFLIFRPMVGSLPGKTPNFLKIIIFIRGNDVLKPGLKNSFGRFIGTE